MQSSMSRWAIGIAALFLAVGLGACRGSAEQTTTVGDISIVNPVVPEPPTELGSAYMTIRNRGKQADRLLRVDSELAGAVELHQTVTVDGRLGMVPVAAVTIDAGDEFDMQTGGFHVMLIDLKRRLKQGDEVPLTLTFERTGKVQVKARVVTSAGGPEPHSGHGR